MYESVKYINHLGEVLSFGSDGLFVNENELHDFEWNVESINNTITGFSKGIQQKRVPARIACSSEAEGIAKRNLLFEIPEKDVIANEYGKLWINGYYCECYVIKSQKAKYSAMGRYMADMLTIATDRPYWIKETEFTFIKGDAQSEGKDYPYDYPYDYAGFSMRQSLDNPAFYDANFRMSIFGPVVNPAVYIGEHLYQVESEVPAGSYLTIDSIAHTITIIDGEGNKVNAFNARNRDSYIFEKIPAQSSDISWDNTFDFTITICEERSVPKWT